MSSNADLPDLNVWLALATPDYFHHQLALNYWEQKAAEQVHFCTVTALGLVSFDRDFECFGGLQRLSLSSGGSSGQPTLIQFSDGLKFRILMQQRCSAETSRCGDPGISNGKPMQRLDPGGLQQ